MHLDTLKLVDAHASRVNFQAGDQCMLVIEPHAPGVFRVRCGKPDLVAGHFPPGSRAKVHAEALMARPEPIGEAVLENLEGQAGWRILQGELSMTLHADASSMSFAKSDREIFSLSSAGIQSDETSWTVGFKLSTSDKIYGLGETPGDLDRRGEVIVSDDPAHRALPLAWSPSGWGLYVNSLNRVIHDLGAADEEEYLFTVEDAVLDVFVFIADPSEILNQYTQLTGRAGQPSLWAMGVWLEQHQAHGASQTADLLAGWRKQQIALDGVMMQPPAAWTYQETKLLPSWDQGRFPDARQALELFARHSAHLCAHALPAVFADSPLFEELEDRGWLLAEDSGDAHRFKGLPVTDGRDFGLLDLTHRDVFQTWQERHRLLAEEGVGACICDVQFDIPEYVVARGGESGGLLNTLYPLLARRALYDAVAMQKVPPEGIVISSDLFPGVQRFPWQSPPRVPNTWAGMQHTLRTALSIGSSAVPVQMHSIGNPHDDLSSMTQELYLRWLAMGVFSGNFVISAHPGLSIDAFDESTRALIKNWLHWRYRLIPYVLGAIEDAARTGLPVQRSMAMCFPEDAEAHRWDHQYLLGPALLVAPIIKPGSKTQIYLPRGDAWWDLNTGWRYEGGTTLTMECGLDTIPVFGREGHMLCLGPVSNHIGEFNSARILDEVWMFGMPLHHPVVMRNKIRVMQMQGSSYIKGLEGLKILPSEGLEVKRRGAEVRISRAR